MNKKVLKIFFILIFTLLLWSTISNAAISAPSKTVNSGENVSILVTSDVSIASYTVTATSYSGLEFVTSTGGQGEGTTSISDAKATGGMKNLATFTFKAPQVTQDTTYEVKFEAVGMGDVDLNSIPNSTCTAKITVKAPVTPEQPSNPDNTGDADNTSNNTGTTDNKKSSEARLSNLGINPKEYDFSGFKANTYEYTAKEVPNDVTEVEVYAKAKDTKATIEGTGKKTLKEGENKLEVVVTAEDGSKKTYTIVVTRKVAENTATIEEPTTTEEKPKETEEKPMLTSLKIKGIELTPKFDKETYEYKATLTEDLTELEIEAIASDGTSKIEIAGNKELKDGENIITILVYDEETEKVASYQITVTKVVEEVVAKTSWFDFSQWSNRDKIILFLATLVIIVVIALLIIKIVKKHKTKGFEEQIEFPGVEELDKAMLEHKEVLKNNSMKDEEPDEEENEIYDSNEEDEAEEELIRPVANTSTTSVEIKAIQDFFNNKNDDRTKRQKRGKHF